MLIEEYGLGDPQKRNATFETWLKSVERLDAMGDMLWMLGLPKGEGQPYAPDQYVIGSVAEAPAIRVHAGRAEQAPT